jgi:hypothetical protein
MRNFKLSQKFDTAISICAIDHGHELRKSFPRILKNIYLHLNKNALLIFDLNFYKDNGKMVPMINQLPIQNELNI